MQAEGWYVDPYGAHERRWFSNNAPTSLVWDGGATSRDDPPDFPPPLPLIEVGPVDSGADDLIRADEMQNRKPKPRVTGSGWAAEAALGAAERARNRQFRIRGRRRGNPP